MSATSEDDLDDLVARIRACRVCRETPRGAPLPHTPRPVLRVSATASILVASQAPGTKVHLSGLPFTDASGDRLRAWMGVDKDTFYDAAHIAIAPMGFCFPGQDASGGDLPPRRECVATWHDTLFATLPPFRLILAVGRPAQAYHLARLGLAAHLKPSLTETVANWRAVRAAGETLAQPVAVYTLPHPSWRNTGWLKKNPYFEAELLPQLQADIARALGRG
ncbi:uracil-DNA glycosylase family protein [Xanthobacter aminoxidans]|uniref:uracil-DNA glycosylase family protein n=1 Tax=Xanthobacter aminoxidans TaxID=186280 RepID=UPI002022F7F2|nr:uracil-DNA glycosylase family protein [Xanthobacter aminoxidans]MCL8382453.1 uracil-DNA glycosylase family protein [Xanthobacter aminoxidans]